MFDFETVNITKDEDKNTCRGKLYRCQVSRYINSKGAYVETIRMNPLKRKSCPGCERCGWMDEYIHEEIYGAEASLFTDDPVHGAIYRYDVTDTHRDWESGYTEIDATGFILQTGEK